MYGAASDARSLRLGAVFDLSGPAAAIGTLQARSSELAISQLNAAGGVALQAEGKPRPLTLIVCDRNAGTHEAINTLVEQLSVKAIIGPAGGQAFAELASDVAVPKDLLLLGPNALREEANGLRESDLTWGMTLSEPDRVPMLMAQLRAIEAAAKLRTQARPLKIAVVMRADGPMTSLRMSQAQIAPRDETAVVDLQHTVVTYEYLGVALGLTELVSKLAGQRPDIVVADGAAEIVTDLITPLELALSKLDPPSDSRPHYLLTESAQVPQLLTLAAAEQTLQQRVSIIAAVPTQAAAPVYVDFERAYAERFGEAPRGAAGAAASYAAVYALAFGLMAADQPLGSGNALALGMRQLTGGALSLTTSPVDLGQVSDALLARRPINVTGTLSELGWTAQGSPRRARVGSYCIGRARQDGRLSFVSTGYEYDIASGALLGDVVLCAMQPDSAPAASPLPNAGPPSLPDAGTAMDGMDGMDGVNAMNMDAAVGTSADTAADAHDAGQTPQQQSPTDVGLAVQYYPSNTQPFDGVIGPALKIINRNSDTPISLCGLMLRYYFSNEHAALCPQDCVVDGFYSGLQPSGVATEARRRYHADGGSAYLEITFPCSEIALSVGESVEMQQQFHTEPYQDFDESDDYSFRFFPAAYADWDRVTLHQDGVLVWGRPPQ